MLQFQMDTVFAMCPILTHKMEISNRGKAHIHLMKLKLRLVRHLKTRKTAFYGSLRLKILCTRRSTQLAAVKDTVAPFSSAVKSVRRQVNQQLEVKFDLWVKEKPLGTKFTKSRKNPKVEVQTTFSSLIGTFLLSIKDCCMILVQALEPMTG